MSGDSALSVVASFDHAHAAHMAVQRLEAAGIAAFVQDEHTIGAQPFFDVAIGGVKVAVAAQRLEEAREVLGEKDTLFRGAELPRESRGAAAFLTLCLLYGLPVAGLLAVSILALSDHVAWAVGVCVVSALLLVASYRRLRRPGARADEADGPREDEPGVIDEG